jgi:hypothetical protein
MKASTFLLLPERGGQGHRCGADGLVGLRLRIGGLPVPRFPNPRPCPCSPCGRRGEGSHRRRRGIADRRGYRAALALGAQGVQIGTRLIATVESPAPAPGRRPSCRAGTAVRSSTTWET